jgi:hypothetical protein
MPRPTSRERIMLHTNDAKSFRFLRLAGALVLVSLTFGCQKASDRVPVAGQVTWQNQPLSRGSILFVPTDGHRGPKVGGEVVAGRYLVERERGPSPGAYRVEVRSDTGERPHSPTDKARDRSKSSVQLIPKEYNDNTKLKVTIKADDNGDLSFDLPLQ